MPDAAAGDPSTPPADPLRHHGDAEVRGAGLLDLAVNVYPDPRPGWLDAALRASLDEVGAYPDPAPAEPGRRRTACRWPTCCGSAGAAEAFSLVARLRRWQRPVVVHPQFTEPHAALEQAGHRVTCVLTRPEDGFALDPPPVPADADLVVVGNPTNPTGRLHPAADLLALRRPGRLVVVDEAFIDTVPGEAGTLAGEPLDGLVVLRSLTKHWSIPGVRAGYLLGAPDVVAALRREQVPWSVSTTATAAIEACCTVVARAEADRRARTIAAWRVHLAASLAAAGVTTLPSDTSFLLARLGAGGRERLRARGVAVRRCDTFPGLDAGWVRVAVRPPEVTDLLVSALAAGPGGRPTTPPGGPVPAPVAPDATSAAAAAERLAGLAVPTGALGRLGELAHLALRRAGPGAAAPARRRAAGDLRRRPRGGPARGVGVPARDHRRHGAHLRGRSRRRQRAGRRPRGTGAGARPRRRRRPRRAARRCRRAQDPSRRRRDPPPEDALTAEETQRAVAVGRGVAEQEVAAGAQLLLSGDMGIGNTTPAAALVADSLGLGATGHRLSPQ